VSWGAFLFSIASQACLGEQGKMKKLHPERSAGC